jgi:transaldolase / glucose-6-phosphate isomerase
VHGQNHYYRTHVNRFSIAPGPVAAAFAKACLRLQQRSFADALWNRQLDVWSDDAATQRLIGNRLGWLDALTFITPHVDRLTAFAQSIRGDGFTDVVLLGMGGSSLAPEVLRQVLGVAPGFPRFRMLDSTDPAAVRAAMDTAATTLFVLASKSGSTIEPNAMAAEARRRVHEAGLEWGPRVIAITDPDTALHKRALAERFRDVFVNPADIGGRYSALSFFGMVPAALMGADLSALLDNARAMEAACRNTAVEENPGLALGAFMAAGALTSRDKLTLALPQPLASLGLWIEQLVAESTGKKGKGVVPIAGETTRHAGDDRVLALVRMSGDVPSLPSSEIPEIAIEVPGTASIGAEFLRWEVATAAAGFLLDVNPFDEPNVTQAKDATRAILDLYTAQKRLSQPESHAAIDGARLTLSNAAEQQLAGEPAVNFLKVLGRGDYLGILVYLPPDDPAWDAVWTAFRERVTTRTAHAAMFGYGPRYLHSTGQLHKGGANNGAFVVITAGGVDDLAIPGEPYSFGVLEQAQALGDFRSLEHAGRRALLVHLPTRDRDFTQKTLEKLLTGLDS